ncbi:hypothetical protein [Ruminococcus sp. HUN007]|uniref:hypothetical protein n=1 Tax=Ruminococcus sp. HUN007 TaxID=1514668 RepID=UPI0005D225A4|nr:hypothetical protein [Ruminococcus sp. HUN007]
MINDRFTKLADAEIGTSLSRPVLISGISESVAKNGKNIRKNDHEGRCNGTDCNYVRHFCRIT